MCLLRVSDVQPDVSAWNFTLVEQLTVFQNWTLGGAIKKNVCARTIAETVLGFSWGDADRWLIYDPSCYQQLQ